MYAFVLPDIGEGISEAQLIAWSVAVGDQVAEGDEVATVSTDKVDVELPAPCAGRVAELCWTPGDTIPVGSVLLRIDDGKARENGAAKRPAADAPIVAAPSTRRLAQETGVDLAAVAPSGPEGRILRRDVEAAAEGARAPEPERPPSAPPAADGAARREPLLGARAAAAKRLAESVHTLAHSTIAFEVFGDGIEALLAKLAPEEETCGVKFTPTAVVAKCAAAALRHHPRLNATIAEEADALLLHTAVNMSVAVATPAGLVVPVVRDVAAKALSVVAAEIGEAARRAREGGLDFADFADGTFTLSSTGGLERAYLTATRPIVNPPQTAILWVSRIRVRPRVAGNALEAGPVMACSLSFDHRFIDGADATRFINDLAELLECPERALA